MNTYIPIEESETREFISKELKDMSNGPLENLLRHILFSEENTINWQKTTEEMYKQYPEREFLKKSRRSSSPLEDRNER